MMRLALLVVLLARADAGPGHDHDHDEHAHLTCTLADGSEVADGWKGKDASSPTNWCNQCECHGEYPENNGGLINCTEMGCEPRNTKRNKWCKNRKKRCAKSLRKGSAFATKHCAGTCANKVCENMKSDKFCNKNKNKRKCDLNANFAANKCAKTCGAC